MRSALLAADLVLIPVQPSPLDGWASAEMLPGLSVFIRRDGAILHSYSTFLRGLDMQLPMYHLFDRTPLGRQETQANSMAAGEASWIRYHDSYGAPDGGCCACG